MITAKRIRFTHVGYFVILTIFLFVVLIDISPIVAAPRGGRTISEAELRRAENREVECYVMTIISGDTIRVKLDNGRMQTIHLKSVRAPKRGERYYEYSKLLLEMCIHKKRVKLEQIVRDEKGDFYARVLYTDPTGVFMRVNGFILMSGSCEHVFGYDDYDEKYTEMEDSAKEEKIGIWSKQNGELLTGTNLIFITFIELSLSPRLRYEFCIELLKIYLHKPIKEDDADRELFN